MSLAAPLFKAFNRDFSPGFLDSPEPDTLRLGGSPDARNAILASTTKAAALAPDDPKDGVRAILRKRTGCTLIAPTALSLGHEVQALFGWTREVGASELLAVCQGQLYKWDGVSAFTAIGAAVFSPTAKIRMLSTKNNVIIMDGTTIKRYNGTALFSVGFLAPTAAPGLATTGAGTITGSYQGYAVWYDSVLDHESSPSPVTGVVAFAAQQRRWTKPAGAPPANVDFWRIYARRTDTFEVNYFRVADVAIGTATYDEQVSDTARIDAGAGPTSSSNNPAPLIPAFAFMGMYKDHGIGVKADESYFYVSKQGDLESWHPADKFAIERGIGYPLSSVTQYGEDTILCKPNRTYRLVGDRLPFKADLIHSEFGNVSQESALEIERMFYGWDAQQGPYVTDLVNWRTLADNSIANTLADLNRDYVVDIKAEHVPDLNLVVWILSTSATQRRRRVMLAYNYRLSCWCPPINGLEFACLSRYTTPAEGVMLYVGDYWGRVYRFFEGESDGAPMDTTTAAVVSSGSSSTVVASGATFYTGGNGLVGQRVLVKSPAGAYQWRRIASNTATAITIDTTNDVPWQTNPEAGWSVYVGAIEFYWWTPWIDFAIPDMKKRGRFLYVEGRSTATDNVLTVHARFNGDESISPTVYEFGFVALGGVWGESIWGESIWGSRARRGKNRRINQAFFSMQVGFFSFLAGHPIDVTAFGVNADPIRRTRAA